ncbi:MAG: cobaltochelatase subunit CobN, partial [Desulfobacteraceae bacterium]
MKLKLGSIMWTSHLPMLIRAGNNLDFMEVTAFSGRTLEEYPERFDDVMDALAQTDVILLYRSSGTYWEDIAEALQTKIADKPVICVGHDPSYWSLSTVATSIVAQVNTYISINGEENFTNMLKYIAREVCQCEVEVPEPKPVPWEGLYHPAKDGIFDTVDAYLEWYDAYWDEKEVSREILSEKSSVGILFSRHAWVNNNLDIEDMLIRNLEDLGMKVIPVFSNSVKDSEKGCKGSGEVVCENFIDENGSSRINALIKMQFFPLARTREQNNAGQSVAWDSVEILKKLDVPVFCPFNSSYKTIDEWRDEPQGLNSSLVGFSIAMPEFEGVIEPLIMGARSNPSDELARKEPIAERCLKITRRIANWIRLLNSSRKERKVAFILHNNPCASVEATVGGGAQLDTLESVSAILKRMKETGYSVDPPVNGKELIETIMERKAISEFRWTTVDEIVNKGGVLKQVTKEEYEEWFDTLSEGVKERMNTAWGRPPGEEVDGVPAAMVYDGKILVTGVSYGNAVICVQPKRGCAGSRCDGQVCKILHDPDIPPPHQYMATYRYLERDFGANVIIHVGTHGNLEFLPGKSVGLSGKCYPDIAIGDIPHLYIYNADNPAEGTIAKRRSYAVLVDHMQTVMVQGGLYEGLEELDGFLGEYEQARTSDPGRAHVLQHLIMDAINNTGLD